MPIKGLTDRPAQLPIIGTLRKGDKKVSDNKPGTDLTYFRFVTDDPLATRMFSDAYPDEEALRNINVFLPYKTTDENFDAWIEKWVAGGLIYRSDGETVTLWRNDKGAYSTQPKPDPSLTTKENTSFIGDDGKRSDGSMQVGRLSVIIPELGRLVTVTVMTTSKWDCIRLAEQLRAYESMEGDLRGIPFVIRRRLSKVSTPGPNGKRLRREKWLLSIETLPRYTAAKMLAMERAVLPEVIEGDFTTVQLGLPANATDPTNGDAFQPAGVYTSAPAPAPVPSAGDTPKTNGNTINVASGQELLDLVNKRVEVPYDNVFHLQNALKAEIPNFTWPKAKDGWQAAYEAAVKHANAKLAPASGEPVSDDPEIDELFPGAE